MMTRLEVLRLVGKHFMWKGFERVVRNAELNEEGMIELLLCTPGKEVGTVCKFSEQDFHRLLLPIASDNEAKGIPKGIPVVGSIVPPKIETDIAEPEVRTMTEKAILSMLDCEYILRGRNRIVTAVEPDEVTPGKWFICTRSVKDTGGESCRSYTVDEIHEKFLPVIGGNDNSDDDVEESIPVTSAVDSSIVKPEPEEDEEVVEDNAAEIEKWVAEQSSSVEYDITDLSKKKPRYMGKPRGRKPGVSSAKKPYVNMIMTEPNKFVDQIRSMLGTVDKEIARLGAARTLLEDLLKLYKE